MLCWLDRSDAQTEYFALSVIRQATFEARIVVRESWRGQCAMTNNAGAEIENLHTGRGNRGITVVIT